MENVILKWKQSYSCNRPWRPIGVRDVKDPARHQAIAKTPANKIISVTVVFVMLVLYVSFPKTTTGLGPITYLLHAILYVVYTIC
jgi:hypothetical protein